jgi:hypothetical protein
MKLMKTLGSSAFSSIRDALRGVLAVLWTKLGIASGTDLTVIRAEIKNYADALDYKADALDYKHNNYHRVLEEDLGLMLIASQMQTRKLLASRNWADSDETITQRTMSRADNFESYLARFMNLHPQLYKTWEKINFHVNVDEFRDRPELSCGVETRPDARLFSGFVAPYLRGNTLDIGCGPYPIPVYLKGYPIGLISGIDPLEPFKPHPF